MNSVFYAFRKHTHVHTHVHTQTHAQMNTHLLIATFSFNQLTIFFNGSFPNFMRTTDSENETFLSNCSNFSTSVSLPYNEEIAYKSNKQAVIKMIQRIIYCGNVR